MGLPSVSRHTSPGAKLGEITAPPTGWLKTCPVTQSIPNSKTEIPAKHLRRLPAAVFGVPQSIGLIIFMSLQIIQWLLG
jgi:hypothetical protein